MLNFVKITQQKIDDLRPIQRLISLLIVTLMTSQTMFEMHSSKHAKYNQINLRHSTIRE